MITMYTQNRMAIRRLVILALAVLVSLFLFACNGTVKPVPPPVPPPPTSPLDATLHLIVVADTTDPKIGRSVAIDSENMQEFFKSVAAQSNGKLKFRKQVLEGYAITNRNLIQAIENTTIYSKDVIVFSYSGHGFRRHTTASKWPMMNTKGSATDFAQVIAKIKAKQPRQFIALADCCNNFIDRAPEALSFRAVRELSAEAIKCMFVDSNAEIAASGSEPGQFSYGNDSIGGFFTSSFLKNLEEALVSQSCSWKTVFEDARKEVLTISRDKQSPQYEKLR
jgi:hypothetical protein